MTDAEYKGGRRDLIVSYQALDTVRRLKRQGHQLVRVHQLGDRTWIVGVLPYRGPAIINYRAHVYTFWGEREWGMSSDACAARTVARNQAVKQLRERELGLTDRDWMRFDCD